MADLDAKQTQTVEWARPVRLAPATRIRILINDDVLLDRTVPASRTFQGTIIVQGELKAP